MAEFLQQASHFIAGRHILAGKYVSKMTSGAQVFWDGGISRSRATIDVPYANTSGKFAPIATGLWTANGQVVEAPDWFLNQMPPYMLVGALNAANDVLKSRNARAWKSVDFAVYDAPPVEAIFTTRTLTKPRFKKRIDLETVRKWMKTLPDWVRKDFRAVPFGTTFGDTLLWLREKIESEGRITLHTHWLLPNDEAKAEEAIKSLFDKHGPLIIRDPSARYIPRRVGTVLEYPPATAGEAMVVGYKAGEGASLGHIGVLLCEHESLRVQVAVKAAFAEDYMADWAAENPGKVCPGHFEGMDYRLGHTVAINFRLSGGIPTKFRLTKPPQMV
jgi:hypothetical protein